MAPPIAVVRSAWLADPLARQIGPATVALVLHLAARAAEAGSGATIAGAEWLAFVSHAATDRLVAAGVVEVLPTEDGAIAGVRVGGWLLAQVDTEAAIRNRVHSRERMRRLRLRRAANVPGQLPLWITDPADETPAEGESMPRLKTKDLTANLGLCKNCGQSPSVTGDVTRPASDHLYPRADARAMVRTSTNLAAGIGTKSAKSTKSAKRPDDDRADEPPAFRLLLALAGRTRRLHWSWRYPTTATDRLELLEAIRSDVRRARLTMPDEAAIKRAIRMDECNDVSFLAAAGRLGGS